MADESILGVIATALDDGHGDLELERDAAVAVLDGLTSAGYMVVPPARPDLRDPELWDRVAVEIGDHDFTYDLGDSSHRVDVVQIVCQAAAKVLDRG